MSDESLPGGVEVSAAMTPSADSVPGPSESDLDYYGWRVVLAACLGVMAGFGSLFVYTFSVFVKPLAAEFGWSREAISSGFAIAAVTLGLVSPLLGRWIDRYGPRRIILTCMTIYGCAIASLSLLHSGLWQFYVTCFALGVVGNGAAHLAYSRSISPWFRRRLGMALAFVMAGAGLGAMMLPVVAQSIISQSGWRAAYASLGGFALLLGLPLSWRYVRERGVVGHKAAPVAHSGMTWQQGLRSSAFWIVTAILFCEFDQHERSDHSPVGIADRSRTHSRKCSTLRVHTRWIKPAWQDCGGMAAGPIFRAARCAWNQLDYGAGHFSSRSGG